MVDCIGDRRRPAAWDVRRVLIAAMAAAPLLGSAPAAAQWFQDDPMPPQAVARIVARHGFTAFSPPRLAGDVYVVQAIDDDGARVRLVVDAYNGRILRPLGAAAELAPPRPARRLRPWDYTPEFEEDREPVERFRGPRFGREDLVPPRSIGRVPRDGVPLSREAEIDLDREAVEPFRGPDVGREQRRGEPPRRAARVEQPASPAQPARPRAAPASPAPVVETPARPAEAKADAKPDTKPDTKPAATAAAPTPAVPTEAVSPATSVAAPPSPTEKPEPARPAQAAEAKPSAAAQPAAPAATASEPPPKVRIIGGVAPVVPQNPAAVEEGASSEPSKIAR
jgi:hypothetical protein